MIDYLEEQLSHADALLEQVRKLERSAAGLPQGPEENEKKEDGLGNNKEKTKENPPENENRTETEEEVDDLKKKVDNLTEKADGGELAVETSLNETENVVKQRQGKVDDMGAERLEAESLPEAQEEEPRAPEQPSNEEKARRRAPPLAAQLEELERAVSAAASLPAGRRAEAGRGGVSLPPDRTRGWTAGDWETGPAGGGRSGPGGTAVSPSDGALSWAEQADRVFRRDSRRYDGGFYLY